VENSIWVEVTVMVSGIVVFVGVKIEGSERINGVAVIMAGV